jgi:molybdopterin adenylyltransferase
MKAAVLTVSDGVARGLREDSGGPAVAALLAAHGFEVVRRAAVPDDRIAIENALIALAREAQLVVTTGGTGLAARDVTPEATESVSDRLVPGMAERMRAETARSTPRAALSRAVCGVRDATLILNLPGSPKGAEECLRAVLDILPHALDLLAGRTAHPPAQPSGAE